MVNLSELKDKEVQHMTEHKNMGKTLTKKLDFDDVISSIINGDYEVPFPTYSTTIFPEEKILNPSKSAEWNRSRIQDHNSSIRSRLCDYIEAKGRAYEKFKEDVKDAIKNKTGLKDDKAEKIFKHCELRSNMESDESKQFEIDYQTVIKAESLSILISELMK